MMKSRFALVSTAAALMAVGACGDQGEESAEVDAAFGGDAGTTDLSLDASTADAMSIDVAAGGTEPAADPNDPNLGEPLDEPTAGEPQTAPSE